jgi:hypothetical protein
MTLSPSVFWFSTSRLEVATLCSSCAGPACHHRHWCAQHPRGDGRRGRHDEQGEHTRQGALLDAGVLLPSGVCLPVVGSARGPMLHKSVAWGAFSRIKRFYHAALTAFLSPRPPHPSAGNCGRALLHVCRDLLRAAACGAGLCRRMYGVDRIRGAPPRRSGGGRSRPCRDGRNLCSCVVSAASHPGWVHLQ